MNKILKKQKLVIVHGWGGSRKTWEKFIKLARKKYNVFFISLPCFDEEPCPDSVWGIQEYATFLGNKIRKIKQKNKNKDEIILLAHSFGGQVASLLAIQQPQLISRLVLSGPAIVRSKNSFKKILLRPIVVFSRLLRKIKILEKIIIKIRKIGYRLIGGYDYIESDGIKKEIFQRVTQEDLTNQISKINLPTIIFWGEKDKYTPLWQGKKIAQLISKSQLHIKENGKHGLHITSPQWMLNRIKSI